MSEFRSFLEAKATAAEPPLSSVLAELQIAEAELRAREAEVKARQEAAALRAQQERLTGGDPVEVKLQKKRRKLEAALSRRYREAQLLEEALRAAERLPPSTSRAPRPLFQEASSHGERQIAALTEDLRQKRERAEALRAKEEKLEAELRRRLYLDRELLPGLCTASAELSLLIAGLLSGKDRRPGAAPSSQRTMEPAGSYPGGRQGAHFQAVPSFRPVLSPRATTAVVEGPRILGVPAPMAMGEARVVPVMKLPTPLPIQHAVSPPASLYALPGSIAVPTSSSMGRLGVMWMPLTPGAGPPSGYGPVGSPKRRLQSVPAVAMAPVKLFGHSVSSLPGQQSAAFPAAQPQALGAQFRATSLGPSSTLPGPVPVPAVSSQAGVPSSLTASLPSNGEVKPVVSLPLGVQVAQPQRVVPLLPVRSVTPPPRLAGALDPARPWAPLWVPPPLFQPVGVAATSPLASGMPYRLASRSLSPPRLPPHKQYDAHDPAPFLRALS